MRISTEHISLLTASSSPSSLALSSSLSRFSNAIRYHISGTNFRTENASMSTSSSPLHTFTVWLVLSVISHMGKSTFTSWTLQYVELFLMCHSILPIFLIWNLNMSRNSKIALIPILSMAAVASTAGSSYQIHFICDAHFSSSRSYGFCDGLQIQRFPLQNSRYRYESLTYIFERLLNKFA